MSESINKEFESYVKTELGDIAVVNEGKFISPKIQNYYKVWQHQAARIAELEKDAARYLNIEPVAWRYQFADWESQLGIRPAWSYSGHNCKGDLPAGTIIEPLFTRAKETTK